MRDSSPSWCMHLFSSGNSHYVNNWSIVLLIGIPETRYITSSTKCTLSWMYSHLSLRFLARTYWEVWTHPLTGAQSRVEFRIRWAGCRVDFSSLSSSSGGDKNSLASLKLFSNSARAGVIIESVSPGTGKKSQSRRPFCKDRFASSGVCHGDQVTEKLFLFLHNC